MPDIEDLGLSTHLEHEIRRAFEYHWKNIYSSEERREALHRWYDPKFRRSIEFSSAETESWLRNLMEKTREIPFPYNDLDREITYAVKLLREAGFNTFASCQGGKSHSFPQPTIRIRADNDVYEGNDRGTGRRSIAKSYRSLKRFVRNWNVTLSILCVDFDVVDDRGCWPTKDIRQISRQEKYSVFLQLVGGLLNKDMKNRV